MCFDLMPRETAADWDTVAARSGGACRRRSTGSGRPSTPASVTGWSRRGARRWPAHSRPTSGAACRATGRRSSWPSSTSTTPRRTANGSASGHARARSRTGDGGVRVARSLPRRGVPAPRRRARRGRAASATRCARAILHRHRPRSRTRPTPGDGPSSTGSSDAMRDVAERILPGAADRRGHRPPRDRPDTHARRRATSSAPGSRSSSTRPIAELTARTSTSPSRVPTRARR